MADEKGIIEGKDIKNTVTLLLTRLLGQHSLYARVSTSQHLKDALL